METSESENMNENKMEMNFISYINKLIIDNGWILLITLFIIYYVWCNYIKNNVNTMLNINSEQNNLNVNDNNGNNKTKENDNLDALRQARLRLQEDYKSKAKSYEEKMKLKKEKEKLLKITEYEKISSKKNLNGQPESKEESFRRSTYNPLMGSGSGVCYRPSNRNPSRG